MAIRLVVFDVGETLIDESRLWGEWADWLGATRLTFFAALGAVIARGEPHRNAFALVRPDIDLQVEMDRLSTEERFAEAEKEVSPRLRAWVEAARDKQIMRFSGTDVPYNAAIPAGRVLEFCEMSAEAKD